MIIILITFNSPEGGFVGSECGTSDTPATKVCSKLLLPQPPRSRIEEDLSLLMVSRRQRGICINA